MVMRLEVVAAARRHRLKLMVGQFPAEDPARGATRTVKFVIGIIHLIRPENGAQAALVERTVVRHQRETFDAGCYLGPHLGKQRCACGIFQRQPVNPCIPIEIILRLGAD